MTSLNDDNRETIEVDLSDEEFLHIAKLAHERDITFNQMVEIILQTQIDRLKAEENGNA
jgi:purine-nucleoside phosphorylase